MMLVHNAENKSEQISSGATILGKEIMGKNKQGGRFSIESL